MDQPIAAIEFGTKKIKIVVGYELEGQVYVIYALNRPYDTVVDFNEGLPFADISKTVNLIHHFSDPSIKLSMNISDCILALPPKGLEIYETRQITTVISDENKIGPLDIKNLYALIKKSASSLTNTLVTTIPNSFMIDGGTAYKTAPLGVTSGVLTINANIHTLPSDIVKSYVKALEDGKVIAKRLFVSSYANVCLLSSYPDIPETYLLVDIGSNETTVSLVGKKNLYTSLSFQWGGDAINDDIVQAFNINEFDAEKIKHTYGYCLDQTSLIAPICKEMYDDGQPTKHYQDELNQIISKQLDSFVVQLQSAIDALLVNYSSEYRKLPLILVGGGSKLIGLKEYLEDKVENSEIKIVAPSNLGARDPTYSVCLGMILAASKNAGVSDDTHNKIGKIEREE